MKTEVSGFEKSDIAGMVEIWNQVVEEGIAFPQMELLTPETAADFFGVQTWCGVARDEESGKIGVVNICAVFKPTKLSSFC